MKKVSTKEFIWYAITGFIAVFGLIQIIFGIIGHNMTGPRADNFIKQFEDGANISLIATGLIFMAVGVVAAIIVMLVYAKKADREVEKKVRREQRLAAQANANIEIKNAVDYVEEQQPQGNQQ